MYDTINFELTCNDVGDVDFMGEIPCYLTNCVEHKSIKGVCAITGNINGLKVTCTPFYIKIGKGSLCKWYLGDNFKVMGRGDTQKAIEKLSDTLHLPMDKASITRIDVACNIITKHPVNEYLQHLGLLKYAKRLEQPYSLYYMQKQQLACFYDKTQEHKAKGEGLPDLYKGRNVLRYEKRYLKRLPSQFGVQDVKAAMLYQEAFYVNILRQWVQTYKDISKVNDIVLNLSIMKTKRDLYRMGVLSMVERVGGEINILNQIKAAQKRGELTAKQALDLRGAVSDACKLTGDLTIKSEAITELDKKIVEAIKFYR